jgi:hypothetical protein
MKIVSFLLSACFFCLLSVQAQTNSQSVIEDLESPVPGEGSIRINTDSAITALIGTPSIDVVVNENGYVKMNGYRIQIFMSNNSRTAKNEAAQKEAQIRDVFPEIELYITYQAPNWKLLAGDFLTREEASVFIQKIQKAFPSFGKELYTVPDKVKVPIQKNN